jgi:hypothetical protein
MSKIVFSTLVDRISGSLGGSTIKGHAAGTVMKPKTFPRRPRSLQQMTRRGRLSTFAGRWYSLPDTKKKLWEKYASLQQGKMSGFNAFMKANMTYYDSTRNRTYFIDTPPATPGTPEALISTSLVKTSSTNIRIFFSPAATSESPVCIHFAVQTGFSNRGKESWTWLGYSARGTYYDHNISTFPNNLVFKYYLYAFDRYGRKSPRTTVVAQLNTLSGRYGYTCYGLSWYGP